MATAILSLYLHTIKVLGVLSKVLFSDLSQKSYNKKCSNLRNDITLPSRRDMLFGLYTSVEYGSKQVLCMFGYPPTYIIHLQHIDFFFKHLICYKTYYNYAISIALLDKVRFLYFLDRAIYCKLSRDQYKCTSKIKITINEA